MEINLSYTFAISVVMCIIAFNLCRKVIMPAFIRKTRVEIERNPKWLTPKLRNQYYGFGDIDIILADSPYGDVTDFQFKKDHFELVISNDVTLRDVESIARFALLYKLSIKYNLRISSYIDKPAYWLSILCYLLDGRDVNPEGIRWETPSK